ncbi:17764_t:CDS:2 [Entrophospora sp. SA101]|nr:17764_t:CDS:2 [Entrophospora sp. SA101]
MIYSNISLSCIGYHSYKQVLYQTSKLNKQIQVLLTKADVDKTVMSADANEELEKKYNQNQEKLINAQAKNENLKEQFSALKLKKKVELQSNELKQSQEKLSVYKQNEQGALINKLNYDLDSAK